MTAESQTGHPTAPQGWHQTAPRPEPSYAEPQYAEPQFAQPQYGEPQFAQPEHAQPEHAQPEHAQPEHAQPSGAGDAFSGYAGDMPSGLRYTAPTAEPAFPDYPETASAPGYAPPPPVEFAPPLSPPVEFAPPPAPPVEFSPSFSPAEFAPPAAPQAAYPDPAQSQAPGQLPGYLQPFPPPQGFSGRGPRVAPVVVFTLLFGVFGMISASRRAKRAEAVGDSPGRYWMAFGVTLSVGWVVGAIAGILLAVAAGVFAATARSSVAAAGSGSAITPAELSQSMVEQGTYAGKSGKAVRIKAATCAATLVDAHGAGTYRCAVALVDNTRATLDVRAGASGWHIVGKAK